MLCETIDLYRYFGLEKQEGREGTLTTYVPHSIENELKPKLRPGMLVIPGGGYWFRSGREKEPVALAYLREGYCAFTLDYSVQTLFPVPLLEAAMATIYLRENAAKYGLDPAHLAAIGFSAGGHLCGCISILWDDPALVAAFGKEECEGIRPDASILAYPVITSDSRYWHKGSFDNFCGDAVKAEDYSLEKKVRPSTPPCFIWSTSADEAVPAENAMMLYTALRKAGVSVELHIFEKGCHGMSLCNGETACAEPSVRVCEHNAHWVGLALEFLAEQGFAMRKAQ